MPESPTFLWVDDEIESLKPHFTFLEQKGYRVVPVNNGYDALGLIHDQDFDIVFLDENMPGMGGIETLNEIKTAKPNLPVIMVTKNEEESLMEEAIGKQITDFLIKPVTPVQVLSAVKKILDSKKLRQEVSTRDYLKSIQQLTFLSQEAKDPADWLDLFRVINRWELELADSKNTEMMNLLLDQKKEINADFVQYVIKAYPEWLKQKPENRPTLSVDILNKYVKPSVDENIPTIYIVIDCLRTDQWHQFESYLHSNFSIKTDYYFSILPTATPYSRNALFSGLFPSEIENKFPDLWTYSVDSEESLNKYEPDLLDSYFKEHGGPKKTRYFKIVTQQDTRALEDSMGNLLNFDLTAIVFNFVDMVSHARSDMTILKELAADEIAYRSISKSWFEHSFLLKLLQYLATKKVKIIITSDHGAVRCFRGTRVNADKETSTNFRYKYGRNLNVNEKEALIIRNPNDYRLPKLSGITNYIIAKNDFLLLYPNRYNHYLNLYKDSFQHGGISMDEMMVPVSVLQPKA